MKHIFRFRSGKAPRKPSGQMSPKNTQGEPPAAAMVTKAAAAMTARKQISPVQKAAFARDLVTIALKGDMDALHAFLYAYLVERRMNGDYTKSEKDGLDDDYCNVFCQPAMNYIEQSPDAMQALERLTRDYAPFYHQMFVNLLLRHAASEGSWVSVAVALQAGAEANTFFGRPLYRAVDTGQIAIVEHLLRHGADPAVTVLDFGDEEEDKRLKKAFEKKFKAISDALRQKGALPATLPATLARPLQLPAAAPPKTRIP